MHFHAQGVFTVLHPPSWSRLVEPDSSSNDKAFYQNPVQATMTFTVAKLLCPVQTAVTFTVAKLLCPVQTTVTFTVAKLLHGIQATVTFHASTLLCPAQAIVTFHVVTLLHFHGQDAHNELILSHIHMCQIVIVYLLHNPRYSEYFTVRLSLKASVFFSLDCEMVHDSHTHGVT